MMNTAFRSHVAAALLLLPLSAAFVAPPVAAQARGARNIAVVGVKAPGGIGENGVIFVTVFGTPGARDAYVTLGGGVRVQLKENAPGEYAGQHTVSRGDRIDPRQPVVARVQWEDGVRTRNGFFPDELRANGRPGRPDQGRPDRPDRPDYGSGRIERFTVSDNRVTYNSTLRFTLVGPARGQAGVDIPGVVKDLPLRETHPGVYEGSYYVRRDDDLRAFDKAIAAMSVGGRRLTAELSLRGSQGRPDRDNRSDGGWSNQRPSDRDPRWDNNPRPSHAVPARDTTWSNEPNNDYRRYGDSVGNRDGRNPQNAP